MTPPAIVAAAVKTGLDVIAISDHNTAGNVAAVQQAAKVAGNDLTVLPGMEITSTEEAHVLGLFPDLAAVESAAVELQSLLPSADSNYYAHFGSQPLLTADGLQVGVETAALSAATSLDVTAAVRFIHDLGGLAIAAHVDRMAFSVFSQLGFFPKDAGFDGVEVWRHMPADSLRIEELSDLGLPLIASSDSHFPGEIGSAATKLRLAEPAFTELVLAFAGADGRSVACA